MSLFTSGGVWSIAIGTTADIMATLTHLEQKVDFMQNEMTQLIADNVIIWHDLVNLA